MNTIGKRYSQDLCRHLRILVIFHGIMFLIFFFDNKLSFEYNMTKLVAFGTKFTKFKNVHNCANSEKQDSNDAMGLRSVLFLLMVLRSCLHQIYGWKQGYTTALKEKL